MQVFADTDYALKAADRRSVSGRLSCNVRGCLCVVVFMDAEVRDAFDDTGRVHSTCVERQAVVGVGAGVHGDRAHL